MPHVGVNTPTPFDLPNVVAALAILGINPTSAGLKNIARRDVLANIGDPQTYFDDGQPFFWEDRTGAGKGDKFYIAAHDGSAWAWNAVHMWGGV